jgi:hypothetical protein
MEAILDFPSATKKRNLVEDHPVIISIMLQFHRLSSFAVYESSLELHADGKSKIAVTAQLSLN